MNSFLKFFFHFLVIFLSASWILLFYPGFFEIDKVPQKLTTSEQCPEILQSIDSPEDMVRFGGVLLVSSRNLYGLQRNKHDTIENGAIYAYYPRQSQKSSKLEKVAIFGFPTEKRFYPFGMKLFENKTLYVINQSLREIDGELIEILEVRETKGNKIELKYIKTIRLPDHLVGRTNNLAVLSENEVFVSQSMASKYGFINMIVGLFNLRVCGIYYCKIDSINNAQCFKQIDTNSITAFNNGLYIETLPNTIQRLFVSQTLEKQVAVFNIHKHSDPEDKIVYQAGISIDGYPDNIQYDKEQDSYYIGSLGKTLDMSQIMNGVSENLKLRDNVKVWGSVQIIKNNFYVNSLYAETIISLNDLIRAISVAVRIDDKLYLGSAFDNRILVCNFNELFDSE